MQAVDVKAEILTYIYLLTKKMRLCLFIYKSFRKSLVAHFDTKVKNH